MRVFSNIDELEKGMSAEDQKRGVVACIGVFDGVHLGHQELLRRTTESAEQLGCLSMLITFRNHPLDILAPPYAPKVMMSPSQKQRVVSEFGLDLLWLVEFDEDFARIGYREFVEEILLKKCAMKKLVCGYNFRFGHQGTGRIQQIRELSEELGFQAEICMPVSLAGQVISSSYIRNQLDLGHVREAARMLSRPLRLSGKVVRGQNRGRSIGYPTANIETEPNRKVPAPGVYAVIAEVGDEIFGGMMNIGPNPTFDEGQGKLEVFIFDFDHDIYGEQVAVSFLKRTRDTQRFSSPEALVVQLHKDEQECRSISGQAKLLI